MLRRSVGEVSSRSRKVSRQLDNIHREVRVCNEKKRGQAIESHNRKTGFRAINISVDNFVFRGSLDRKFGPKKSLKWRGP